MYMNVLYILQVSDNSCQLIKFPVCAKQSAKAFNELSNLILTILIKGWSCWYFHFMEEKIEAQKD